MKYHAFISYSHAADRQLAPRLKAGLQSFAKPWFKLRALRVFLDDTNLNLSSYLWGAIERALGDSEHFIYLAAPEAAGSEWVQRELAFWESRGRLDKLLIVITGGEFAWDKRANNFDWDHTDCVPRTLSGKLRGEPFWLDLRWARAAHDTSLQHPRFKQDVARLSAALQGMDLEDLLGEELEQHRRTMRWRNGAIVTLSVLLLATTVAAYLAVRESAEARRQEQEALRQRDRAVAAALYNRVQLALGSGALAQAVRWVQAGLQRLGAEPVVQQSAMEVATHSQAVLTTVRELAGPTPLVEFSPDGRQFLVLGRSPELYARARVFSVDGSALQSFDRVQQAEWLPGGLWLLLKGAGAAIAERESDGSSCERGGLWRLERASSSSAHPSIPPAPDLPVGWQAMSADGRRLLSVCGNFVRWGLAGGPLQRWQIPGVQTAALSPDERWIAAAGGGRTHLLPADPAASGPTSGIELAGVSPHFAPDGGMIATIEAGQTLLWTPAGQPMARLPGRVTAVGPAGIVVTQDETGSWLRQPGTAPLRLEGTQGRISADGRWVLTTVGNARTRVVSVSGHELALLDGVAGRFSPASLPGPLVLTATAEGLVRLWDLRRLPVRTPEAAAPLWQLPAGELSPLAAPPLASEAAEGPACNRDRSLTCSADGRARVAARVSLVAGTAQQEYRFLPVGLAAADSRQPAFWEGTQRPEDRCAGPMAPPAFSESAAPVVAIGCADGLLRLFTAEGQLRWERRQEGAVSAMALSRDGHRLLTASAQGRLRLWDATTGEALAEIAGTATDVSAVGLTARGDRAFTLNGQGLLQVWQLQGRGGSLAASIQGADEPIAAARFAGDGTWLVGRTRNGPWYRWLTQPAELKKDFPWLGEPGSDELQGIGLR